MSTVLALAAVPCLALAGLLGLMLIPVNLQLTVTDTALVLEPRGLDVLWTLRRRIELPISAIDSIRIAPRSEAPDLGATAGIHVAGIITAGSFGSGADRAFWNVRRADQLLLISCRPGVAYRTLVLEFADPYATLARTRTVCAPVTA